VDILSLAAPEWFFSYWVFHFVNKNLVLFNFYIILLTHCAHTHLLYIRSQFHFFNWYQSLVHSVKIQFLSVIFDFYLLKCLKLLILFLHLTVRTMAIGRHVCGSFWNLFDCWSIVETGWTKPADAALELVPQKNVRLSNDKALLALCQALSPFEFAKISNCESAQEALQISFNTSDWVLRRVTSAAKDPTKGKLGLVWEGPFRVIKVNPKGAYHLEDPDSVCFKL